MREIKKTYDEMDCLTFWRRQCLWDLKNNQLGDAPFKVSFHSAEN